MFVNHSKKINTSGFTLLECLLAISIGAIFLTISVNVLLGFKKTYVKNQIQISNQEKARFAKNILARAISTAGYSSCGNPIKSAIYVYKQNNSDAIVIRKISTQTAELKKQNDGEVVINSLKPAFKGDDELFITDCLHSELKKIVHVSSNFMNHSQYIELSGALKFRFLPTTIIGQFQTSTFYIAKSKINQDSSLYLKNFRNRTSELVTDINKLNVLCLVKNQWLSPVQVINWDDVKMLKVKLKIGNDRKSKKIIFNVPLEERL